MANEWAQRLPKHMTCLGEVLTVVCRVRAAGTKNHKTPNLPNNFKRKHKFFPREVSNAGQIRR